MLNKQDMEQNAIINASEDYVVKSYDNEAQKLQRKRISEGNHTPDAIRLTAIYDVSAKLHY